MSHSGLSGSYRWLYNGTQPYMVAHWCVCGTLFLEVTGEESSVHAENVGVRSVNLLVSKCGPHFILGRREGLFHNRLHNLYFGHSYRLNHLLFFNWNVRRQELKSLLNLIGLWETEHKCGNDSPNWTEQWTHHISQPKKWQTKPNNTPICFAK